MLHLLSRHYRAIIRRLEQDNQTSRKGLHDEGHEDHEERKQRQKEEENRKLSLCLPIFVIFVSFVVKTFFDHCSVLLVRIALKSSGSVARL